MSIERKSRAETAQETAERLIAVATPAFAAQGFAGVSLGALAAEAGLTRGALHHHFGNKAGLFEAVLRRIVDDLGAVIDKVWESDLAAGKDRWVVFCECFHVYLDEVLRPARRRILFQDGPSVLGDKAYDIMMNEGFGAIVDDLGGMIADGRLVPVDPVALAHLMNGGTINLAYWAADPAAEAEVQNTRRAEAHRALAAMFDGFIRR